jgi:hypothetical protein
MLRMAALMIASASAGMVYGALARADVLAMPESASAATVVKPGKGSSMRAVELAFGAPAVKHPAVGGGNRKQPPITRWDYPAFSVFFEHGHVVDSVVPGSPPPVQHAEELKP